MAALATVPVRMTYTHSTDDRRRRVATLHKVVRDAFSCGATPQQIADYIGCTGRYVRRVLAELRLSEDRFATSQAFADHMREAFPLTHKHALSLREQFQNGTEPS